METWIASYKQHEAVILGILFWLLSIPTGIFINRLDTSLKNRSRTRKIKEIITRYKMVVGRRTELMIYRRTHPSASKYEFPVPTKIMYITFLLTFAIMAVQMISNNAVADVYGKKASDLYFYIIMFISLLLNTIVIAYADKDYSIFLDARFFSKYREKTIIELMKLGYDSGVLDKIYREE